MPATVREVARKAGVSAALVSRLLRNDPHLRVSDKTRKKVLSVHDRLGGIRPNRRRLDLTYNIAMPISSEALPAATKGKTGSPLVRAFEQAVRSKGFRFSMLLCEPGQADKSIGESFHAPRCFDGVLLLAGITDAAVAKLLLSERIPHVSMDRRVEVLGLNTVFAHALGGLRAAIAHLRELGHTQIGYLGPSIARYPAFAAAMIEAGLAEDGRTRCEFPWPPREAFPTRESSIWVETAQEAFGPWLDRGPGATAMVCHNDMTALGAIEAMKQRGLRPGQDISLIGYDNIEQRGPEPADAPILTTIDNPLDLVGTRCAELLLHQILDDQHQVVHEQIPTKLIVRETTGACRERT